MDIWGHREECSSDALLFPSAPYLRARELSDTGDHAAAHEMLADGLAQPIAKVLQDGVTRREAVLLDAWCLLWLRRQDECLDLLRGACRAGWLDSDDVEVSLIRKWIDLHRGQYERVFKSAGLYIDEHREQADWLLAEHLYLHAFAGCRLCRMEVATESCELAIALYRLTRHVPEEIEATNLLGLIHFQESRYTKAIECFDHCCERSKERLDNRKLVFALLNLGILYYKVGDFATARRYLKEAHSHADATTASTDQCRIKLALGNVHRMRRNFTDSRQLLTRAYSEACDLQIPREECLALEFLGDVHRDEARPVEALRYYERGVAIAERIAPQGDLMMELRRRQGECLATLERAQEAEAAFARAEALCESIGDRYELGVLWRCRALASLSAGRLEIARDQADKSATILEAIGAKYELGLSRHAAAQVWLQLADTPRGHVAAAGASHGADLVPTDSIACLERARSHALGAHHLLQKTSVPYWNRQSRLLLEKITERRRGVTPECMRTESDDPVIVATSAEMRHLLATCDRYAGLDVPILVTGETGTGKELIVWRLHNRGKHRDGPLVAVNCAAIPHEIFERELFGHARGAYTGAENNGPGLVAQAEGGTLLLDEIGDLPPMLQPKLLRLLENGTYRRLGDPTERHAHIRLVAATNANLARMTDDGSFRADLLYRLRELEISIPPLRLRRADIVPLFEHFLELMEGRRIEIGEVLTVAEIDNLKSAHLPGNARELRQLARLTLLDADIAYSLEPCPEDGSNLDDVLEKCGGNKAEAARRLGISRSTLYRRLHVTREG